MEEKELRQLAIDIAENKVFGTFHMNKCEIANMSMVFMPLIFMTDKQRKKLSDKKVVHLYEYYHKAEKNGINGMPIFMSMMNIVQKDWNKIVKYIAEYKIKVKGFLNKKENKDESPTLFDEEDKLISRQVK